MDQIRWKAGDPIVAGEDLARSGVVMRSPAGLAVAVRRFEDLHAALGVARAAVRAGETFTPFRLEVRHLDGCGDDHAA